MATKDQLIGTWRLISQETEYADGHREYSRGNQPDGILMYDANGNMSVHLVRTEEPRVKHTDLAAFDTAMEQYHGYFGTYEVDEGEQIVYHNIIGSAFPPYRGTQQIRHFELDGNRLTLFAHATTAGDDTKRLIVWERLTKSYTQA